jgi:TIR domain
MAGNIFINYRREESSHVAGRLHDSLAPTFGGHKLFMDVDNIPVGRDFEEYLNSQVTACDAMLAIIGPNWLTAKDETGHRQSCRFRSNRNRGGAYPQYSSCSGAGRRGSHAKGK